jgi:hypothetical protein
MNLEQHSTPHSHPVAADVNRVFEGSRLLQTEAETSHMLHEQAPGETQAVRSVFTPESASISTVAEKAASARGKGSFTLGPRSFGVMAGALLILGLTIGIPTRQNIESAAPASAPPFETRQRLEQASLAAITATQSAETWLGESRAGAKFATHVRALKTSNILSVRISMRGLTPSQSEFVLCSAETDPTILAEVGPERWSGSVPVYLSLCRGADTVSVVGEADIAIRDHSSPVADVRIVYPGSTTTRAATTSQELPPQFTLSLKESVALTLTTESL